MAVLRTAFFKSKTKPVSFKTHINSFKIGILWMFPQISSYFTRELIKKIKLTSDVLKAVVFYSMILFTSVELTVS